MVVRSHQSKKGGLGLVKARLGRLEVRLRRDARREVDPRLLSQGLRGPWQRWRSAPRESR